MSEPKKYESRPLSWSVGPTNEPHLSEMNTLVKIDDKGAGEFVVVEQTGRSDISKICIDVAEWPTLKATIDAAIKSCRDQGIREAKEVCEAMHDEDRPGDYADAIDQLRASA